MDLEAQRSKTLERLSSIAQSDRISEKAKQRCAGIHDRLESPVLVGILGPDTQEKQAVLNELLGLTVLPRDGPPISLEVQAGDAPYTMLKLADGSVDEIQSYPTATFLAQGADFAAITSPRCAELHCEFVLIECADSVDELREALEWAGTRIDLAIWCTQNWAESERTAWTNSAERVRDHAILVIRSDASEFQDQSVFSEFAVTAFRGPADTQTVGHEEKGLETQMRALIAEAREQDLLSAELFLRRYDKLAPDLAIDASTRPAAVETADQPYEKAQGELGKLFQHVRVKAEKLLSICADPPEDARALLEEFETAMSATADLLGSLPSIEKEWPHLHANVLDAHDLTVLLKFEGRQEHTLQCARLLSQLRDETERAYLACPSVGTSEGARIQ